MEYKIICKYDHSGADEAANQVEKQVNEYLRYGWKIYGNLCVNEKSVFQTMIKE